MSEDIPEKPVLKATGDDFSDEDIPAVIQQELKTHFDAFTSSYNRDSTRGFDLYQTAADVLTSEETDLYEQLNNEWSTNDLAIFLVSHLVNRLLDFRYVGKESDIATIQEFMYRRRVMSDLEQVATQGFVLGTGIIQRFSKGTELMNATRIDATSITISKKRNGRTGELEFTYRQASNDDDGSQDKILNRKHIGTFKPVERPDSAYGESYLKGSLLSLQALRQLQMDIPAGIKRLAYAMLVMKLDLDNVQSEAEARQRIRRAIASFYKHDSATSTVAAIDKNHDLKYVGADGGSVATIMPIMPLVEPLYKTLLVKWHVPMGVFLQEGSNRALIQSQSVQAEKEIVKLQEKFAMFIEQEILAPLFGLEVGELPPVRVEHNLNLTEMTEELDRYITMVEAGILPIEALVQKFGLVIPEGEQTYIAGPHSPETEEGITPVDDKPSDKKTPDTPDPDDDEPVETKESTSS